MVQMGHNIGEKREVSEHEEQEKNKGKDSPTSYEVESSRGARIQESRIARQYGRSQWKRQEEETLVVVMDNECSLTNLGEGRDLLQVVLTKNTKEHAAL